MTRPLVHESFTPFTRDQADAERVDVAIIGGGMSGAYTAWRLQQTQPELKVVLFESSDRIGGRLLSAPLPGMPHVNAELGGMRFIPKTQDFVRELIKQLGLKTRPFPLGPKDDPAGSNNLVYLRRRLMRAAQLKDPGRLPYLLNPTEQGMTPDELQRYVMDSLVPHADQLTQDEWNEVEVLNGEKLYKVGFWNLLYRVLSSEAYQYMDDAGGYYTNVANSNAVLSLPVFEFGPSVVYETLDDGYEALPRALAAEFQKAGGDVRMNRRLDSFGRNKQGEYAMVFVETEPGEHGKTGDRLQRGRRVTHRVVADRVVLAVPRRSLELINWRPFARDPKVRGMVESVISQAAFKIFLAYPYPWWRVLGLQAGRSITDMPLRQTFYFQTEGEQPGADKKNNNSLMMVSYNDLGSVPFWKALEEGDPFPVGRNPFASPSPSGPDTGFPITRQMVEAAQAQVREVHGLDFVPRPYAAAYHDWSDDPYGGGWHAWKAGFRFWEIMPRIRKPVADENVFICGEAYSINQGWVEGALQTAELMLDEHFGLTPPSWLPSKYNLGY